MISQSTGDLARAFTMQSAMLRIKLTLDNLTKEAADGHAADFGKRLSGNLSPLHDIDARTAIVQQYERNGRNAGLFLRGQEVALNAILNLTDELAPSLLVWGDSQNQDARSVDSEAATDAFRTVVSKLNSRVSGQSLFSGTMTDKSALIPADAVLNSLKTKVNGASSAAEIIDMVSDWFDNTGPGDSFLNGAYGGNNVAIRNVGIGEGRNIRLDVTAADHEIRNVLKGLAISAIAGQDVLPNDIAGKHELLRAGAQILNANHSALIKKASSIGLQQEELARSQIENSTSLTALKLAKLQLIQDDPAKTSAAIRQTEDHLNAMYLLTSRLSRLRFADYLR